MPAEWSFEDVHKAADGNEEAIEKARLGELKYAERIGVEGNKSDFPRSKRQHEKETRVEKPESWISSFEKKQDDRPEVKRKPDEPHQN